MTNYSWAGTWSSNTYYEVNTFVKHENIAYVSTNSVQGSNPPPLDMLNWNVFVIGYQTPITPTPTSTISTTPTATPTPTVTETPTPTPTVTVTPTETETPTPTPTPTITVTPTETETPTPTPTITQTPTVTPTELVLINPILAGVDEYIVVGNDEYLMFVDPVSPTPTPTPTVTETPTPTPTSTETPTPTPTSTETPTPTQTSTETPTPTVTPSSVLGSLFEMVLFESGSDVIMSGTGQFNLTDLVYRQTGNFTGFIIPNTASLSSGTNNLTPTPVDLYTGSTLTFPPNFGVSGITNANSGSGNMVSVIKQGSIYNLVVPSGYTSNTTLITQSTFTGKTLSSLGVTVGTYNYTWGSGVNAGTLKLTIG